MLARRSLLIASAAAATLASPGARAIQRRSMKDPLRLGVDPALIDSGFTRSLLRAFTGDTGVVLQVSPMPALPLLDALERGEFDAAFANAPEAEQKLDKQGLVHDRRALAESSFVIVGPAPTKKQPDPAGLAKMTDTAAALVKLREAALAAPGTIRFLTTGDGSGTHVIEQAAWRAAKIAPAAPWYAPLPPGRSLVQELREGGGYAIVERGVFAAQGGAPLGLLVDDPALAAPVHVMRSFRVQHAAGNLFVDWIAGSHGRRVVAGLRGYRPPAAKG